MGKTKGASQQEEAGKRSKKRPKSVDLEELARTAWEHFRNFIEEDDDDGDDNDDDNNNKDETHFDENDDNDDDNDHGVNDGKKEKPSSGISGDVDELQEILTMLQPHVMPLFSLQETTDLSTYMATIQTKHGVVVSSLLPVLISVAFYHLATANISQYIQQQEQEKGQQLQQEQQQTYDIHLMNTIEEQITCSLEYFPWNAAMWSMGANFGRCTQTMEPTLVGQWYERAALCASQVRSFALKLLLEDEKSNADNDSDDEKNDKEENDDDGNKIKEWIELLLLQQVTGVEWTVEIDETNEEEKEEGEDDEVEEEEEAGSFSFSTVEATSRFMAAMLHSTEGRHDLVVPHLTRFQLTHRIHPNVWTGQEVSIAVTTAATDSSKITFQSSPWSPTCFSPSVLPPHLYERMCQVFAPDAVYWKESDYGNRGYYSYFMDFEPTDTITTCCRRPRNLIEDVIVQHLLPLAQQVVLPATTAQKSLPPIVGFEWWVHTRPIQANLGHNLHFDTEESFLEETGQITHPVISSVLCLTGNNNNNNKNSSDNGDADPPQSSSPAGATIILDQSPDSQQVAKVCWRNAPRDNTFLVFPGNLLHGVLPCPGVKTAAQAVEDNDAKDGKDEMLNLLKRWKQNLVSRKSAPSPPPSKTVGAAIDSPAPARCHRLTFMVGFWTRRVPDQMKEQRLYGPCGPLPTDAMWVQDICRGYEQNNNSSSSTNGTNGESGFSNSKISEESRITGIVPQLVPLISPAWEELPMADYDKADDSNPPLQLPRAIDHRFFVHNAPECFRESLFEKD